LLTQVSSICFFSFRYNSSRDDIIVCLFVCLFVCLC
jgi:hypothetical protein